MRKPPIWWFLLGGWSISLFLFSAIPGSSMPQVTIPNFDKIEHTTFFSVGAFLLTGALTVTFPGRSWPRRIALAVVAVSLFGWVDEWHQTFTPGRSGNDFYDWLSDTCGAMIGAFGSRWSFHYARNSRRFGAFRSPGTRRVAAAAD